MITMIKKELKKYLLSQRSYFFIGIFLIMLSIFFYVDINLYGSTEFGYMFYSGSTILTFTVPLLTMKMFSEEKKYGIDTLFSSTKTTTKIVLSKFISSVIVVLTLELFTFIYMGILKYFGNPYIVTGMLTLFGFLLLSMAYISVGFFISSITKKPIISVLLTMIIFLILWITPSFNKTLLEYSLLNNFIVTFLNGLLSFKVVILLLSFTMFFLSLTIMHLRKNDKKNNVFIIVIMIAILCLTNKGVRKLNITPLDCTREGLYTLTDKSKELVKNIDKEVKIYFFGFSENEAPVILAQKYNQVNEKIIVEIIDISQRQDLSDKYGVQINDRGIIIQGPDKYKVLTSQDLNLYNNSTGKYLDISEEKLTNAILDITIKDIPNIYFITGHKEFDILKYGEMYTLNIYLQNDINNIKSLDLSNTDMPEDCDLIVIASPQEDYNSKETEILINYINNGGNILWLNDATFIEDLPNLTKLLEFYGIELGNGVIVENNTSNMLDENPYMLLPEINYHKITEDFYTNKSIVFPQPTKLEIKDEEYLSNSNIEINKILLSSVTSVYFEDLENIENYQTGPFVLGLESTKKLDENKTSKLIIYSNNFFVTDTQVTTQGNNSLLVNLGNNMHLALNSIAYLTKAEKESIGMKDTGSITVSASKKEDNVIRLIIFTVPIIIISAGVVIKKKRR